MGTTPGDIFY